MRRTYTRKRPEYREIEGVQELCRLCLEKPQEAQPIFPQNSEDIPSFLALRIMICVGLEVTREDTLPNLVCSKCHKELERSYSFRKKCEVSYRRLKSHILAVKEKECKSAAKLREEKRQNEIIKHNAENQCKKQGLVFKVDVDGSMQLCESALSENQCDSSVTLAKLEPVNFETSETIVFDENKMQQMKSDEIKFDSNVPCLENAIVMDKSEESPPDMDLSSFLSTMLLELGILTQRGDDIVVMDSNIRTIELETGDGNQITLKLMEESEEEKIAVSSEQSIINENEAVKDGLVDENAPVCSQDKKMGKNFWSLGAAWCAVCCKRFASRSVLARHARDVHARRRPHECPHCGKRFAQKEVMLRHQFIHQDTRPFQCTQCSKSFTQRGSLETHTRLHAPPDVRSLSLYQCSRCPKVFLHHSGLSRHMTQHKGKAFKCGSCSRSFKDRSSLIRHTRVMRHIIAPPATNSTSDANGGM